MTRQTRLGREADAENGGPPRTPSKSPQMQPGETTTISPHSLLRDDDQRPGIPSARQTSRRRLIETGGMSMLRAFLGHCPSRFPQVSFRPEKKSQSQSQSQSQNPR
ncbi:hypothetical protein G6O67_003672 [Ophiocordyceps sinensis]|uniref:Uncharacterized protein n=1 Tax=Ophiocordyceps sinensis TaxID=72228 RepID=A0A8H4PS77_9HYPO|nr:hypothetical protein G6O67_003672 [Ophiocordyceps sinensis]